jgi:hypothetical protein
VSDNGIVHLMNHAGDDELEYDNEGPEKEGGNN